MEIQINYTAVLIAVVANFILGFIWYTPLFGKTWAKELGFDTNVRPDGKTMARGLTFMIIGNFLMAYVFAHNIGAWTYVPGYAEDGNFANAMAAAVFTWMGFYLPVDIGGVIWERRSWKLFFINTGYHLISLIVVAFILVYMAPK